MTVELMKALTITNHVLKVIIYPFKKAF